jgi:hypothetical protein
MLKLIDRSQPKVASNNDETRDSIRLRLILSQRLHRVGQWEQEIGEVAGPFPLSVTLA